MVGQVKVTMTHAIHSCGILDEGKIVYGGEAAGYVLRFADGRTACLFQRSVDLGVSRNRAGRWVVGLSGPDSLQKTRPFAPAYNGAEGQ